MTAAGGGLSGGGSLAAGGTSEAKVAQILTAQDLVLNKGSDDGLAVGQRFAILSEKGAAIKDPDTGEVLDSVEIAKTLVKVVSVTKRVAVARTFRSTQGISPSAFLLGERHETLRSDARKLQQELDPKDSFVKIGDRAKRYSGQEYGGIVYDW